MKKEKWIKIISGLACALLVCGVYACGGNSGKDSDGSSAPIQSSDSVQSSIDDVQSSSDPTQSSVEDVEFNLQLEDLSVDVTQIPEALYIDEYTLEKVTLDEKVLKNTEYVARNGYFIFACEEYGALGVGAKTVRMQFTEGEASFTLTVTDGKAPVYELPQGKVFLLPTTGSALPSLTRVYKYQTYVTTYTLKDASDAVVYEKTNPTAEELNVVLENGRYRQSIVVTKDGETIDSWEGKLIVADEDDIEFVLPEKQLLFLGEQTELPCSIRFSGEPFEEEGTIVYKSMDENVVTISENGIMNAVANGSTQINVTVLGALEKSLNVTVGEMNIFSQGMAPFWSITTRLDEEGHYVQGSRGDTVWDESEQALVIEKESYMRDNSGGSMRIRVSAIEPMLALGAEYCTFEMKVNETYMDTKTEETYKGNTPSQKETQLVGTMGTGFVSGAGTDAILQDALVANEWVTITLNTTKLVNKYNEGLIDTLFMYLGGKKNSVIYLRNFKPIISTLGGASLDAETDVTLFVDETHSLSTELTVDGMTVSAPTLTYTSMNENVVTVTESGELIPVGYGSTQIAVESKQYGLTKMVAVSITNGDILSYEQCGSGTVGTMRKSKEVKNNDCGGLNQLGYWNETEQAYVMYKYSRDRDFSNGCVRFGVEDTPALKALLDRGVEYVKFDIKVDETYMSSALDNGVKVWEQTRLQMAWMSADKTKQGFTASVAKGSLTAGEYVTVYFDISKCLQAYRENQVKYVYIFLGGQELSEICLKNFAPSTEDEFYTAYDPFSYVGGATAEKTMSAKDATGTTQLAGGRLSTAWDEEECVYTIYKYATTDNGIDSVRFYLNGENPNNVTPAADYFMKKLSESKTAEGKAYLKFDLKVDEKYFTGECKNKAIMFYGRRISVGGYTGDSSYVRPLSVMKADEWATVYVDVTNLVKIYDEGDLKYFQLTTWGPIGSQICFKNLRIATQEEFTAWNTNNG